MPIGSFIEGERVPLPGPGGGGSVVVIVASDAPLLPHQCARLAQRAGLGIARLGAGGEHFSGDLFLAFATGNRGLPASDYEAPSHRTVGLRMFSNRFITPLFEAVADATEEAVLNALLAAETMTGRDGITAHALEADALAEALRA